MIECVCVQRHVPLPVELYMIKLNDKVIPVCPTTYVNVKQLLTEFVIRDGVPPGRISKHYSAYVRGLALQLWKESKSTT